MFTRALSFFAAAVFSLSSLAAGPEAFEGHDYTRLKNAQPVATGKKVEVLEFFWYRCPHCFQLEPAINAWVKTLPGDAQVRRVPAVFREDWMPGAKLYYTLEQMNLIDKPAPQGIRRLPRGKHQPQRPGRAGRLDRPARGRPQEIRRHLPFVLDAVKGHPGARLATAYAISGVPAFIIDGKYATSMSMTGGEARLFDVLDQLIVKARAERSGKKATK